jgi:hypothetical protein
VDKGTALARLTVLGNTSPIIQASEPVVIDAIAPSIGATFPENGAIVENARPLIYAALTDTGGMGIDPSRGKVFVDGQDVSGSANMTASYIDYKPSVPLASGQHSVRVVVVDSLGNHSTSEWPFVVTSHRYIDRFETNVDPGTILSAGQTIRFTMQGPANGDASASILGVARHIPLHEDHPGFYRGEYIVKAGDSATESPIVGRLKTADGHELTTLLSNGLNVAAGTPGAPVIESPLDGASVNGRTTIAGTAPPLSTVRVTVHYHTKAAGDLVDLTGTAATRAVMADAAGNWSIDNLPLGGNALLSDEHNTQYTISAIAIDPTGNRSAESTVSVEGGRVYAHHRGL